MKKVLIVSFLIGTTGIYAQNIGINATGSNPDASAILDVESSDKGMLIPRVALVATNNSAPVSTPATSLLVYNTATSGSGVTAVAPGFYYWNGTDWEKMITGNTISTTDDQNLTGATLVGTNLQIDIENGSSTSVDLASLQDGTGTDSQTLTLTGNTLAISGGNNVTLTDNVNDADFVIGNEYNTGASLSGTTLSITDGGGSQTVNLSGLQDHDWYEVGGTTQPNAISDNIYTQGNVGIGVPSPEGPLHMITTSTGNDFSDGIGFLKGTSGNDYQLQINATGGVPHVDLANSANEDFDIRLGVYNDNKLAILGGDVGLGIQNPNAHLEVRNLNNEVGIMISNVGYDFDNLNLGITFVNAGTDVGSQGSFNIYHSGVSSREGIEFWGYPSDNLPGCCNRVATFKNNGDAVFVHNLGIGTGASNSAKMEVASTTKGVLFPRMSEVQKNAIAAPATGLLVYQLNNTNGFYYYDGTQWVFLGGGGSSSAASLVYTTNGF